MFNQNEFNKFLIDNKVVGFFDKPVTLKSGRQSYWYANCRNLLDTFGHIDKLSDYVINFLKDEDMEFDYVYGVPAGVTKLADIVNYKLGITRKNPNQKLVIGREKPKEHGAAKDKYFIGDVKEGDKVVVLEDVTTTGGSLLDSIKELKEAKADIVAALGIVNRMEKRDDGKSVEQAVNEKNIPYYAMSDAYKLLPLAVEAQKPIDEVIKYVVEGFQKYGIRPLKL